MTSTFLAQDCARVNRKREFSRPCRTPRTRSHLRARPPTAPESHPPSRRPRSRASSLTPSVVPLTASTQRTPLHPKRRRERRKPHPYPPQHAAYSASWCVSKKTQRGGYLRGGDFVRSRLRIVSACVFGRVLRPLPQTGSLPIVARLTLNANAKFARAFE